MKNYKILVIMFFAVLFISACVNNNVIKDDKKNLPVINSQDNETNSQDTNTQNNGTNTETVVEGNNVPDKIMRFDNIAGWNVFGDKNFNFIFSYPDDWRYELKQNDSIKSTGLVKAEFFDQSDNLVLVVSNVNPEIGYETYYRLDYKAVGTNDKNTDILITYFSLDNEISGIEGDFNMILLEWHKDKKCGNPETDCLSGQLTGGVGFSGNMIMVNYPRINNVYYKSIADKISKTFSFVD